MVPKIKVHPNMTDGCICLVGHGGPIAMTSPEASITFQSHIKMKYCSFICSNYCKNIVFLFVFKLANSQFVKMYMLLLLLRFSSSPPNVACSILLSFGPHIKCQKIQGLLVHLVVLWILVMKLSFYYISIVYNINGLIIRAT